MPNYYEILTIEPTATSPEIEAAIESHYNQVRRLTTHHNTDIVNQANQALSILEQARTTLLDPYKRSNYDASLGLGISGIADPNLAGSAPVTTTGAPSGSPLKGFQAQSSIVNPVQGNVWQCSQCQRLNPVGIIYCQNCGNMLGRICPNCQTTYESKANFCPGCGQNYEIASKRAQLNLDLNNKQNQRLTLLGQANSTSTPELRSMEYLAVGGSGWALFTGLMTGLFLVMTIFRLIFSFINHGDLQQPAMLTILGILSGVASLLRWAIWAGVIGLFVYLILKKGFKFNVPALVGYGLLSLLAIGWGGINFRGQVLYGYGNSWLIFPALVTAGLIGITWMLLRHHTEPSKLPAWDLALYKRAEPYTIRLLQYNDKSPMAVAGVGIGLSLLTMLFSSSRSVLGLIAGVFSLGACAILAILTYRAHTMTAVEKSNFLSAQEISKNNLSQIESEISSIEQQLKDLGTPKQEKI